MCVSFASSGLLGFGVQFSLFILGSSKLYFKAKALVEDVRLGLRVYGLPVIVHVWCLRK